MSISCVQVISWLLLTDSLHAQSPWLYDSSTFPSNWFGGNISGSDVPNLVRNNVQLYSSAYFGWQLMNNVSGCQNEEQYLHQQVAGLKALNDSILTAVYAANGGPLLPFYEAQRKVLDDPSCSGFFLQTESPKADAADRPAVGARGYSGACATAKQVWDFRNSSARDYFVDYVVGIWAQDPATDSVFIDMADEIMCRGHPALPSIEDRYAWSNGSVEVYRRSATILAAVGKRLILSFMNGFEGFAPITTKVGVCPVPLDKVVAAMRPAPWIRFHEYWGAVTKLRKKSSGDNAQAYGCEQKECYPSNLACCVEGTTMCNNLMHTAIRQAAEEGMAFSAHGGDYWNNYPTMVQKTSLHLSFAMFMIAQNATTGGERDFFGWSNSLDYWQTKDWHWSDTAHLYRKYGEALRPATFDGDVWMRQYEHATFSVNCGTLEASVEHHELLTVV